MAVRKGTKQSSGKPDPIFPLLDEDPESYFIWNTKFEFRHPMHSHQKAQLTYFQGGAAFLHTPSRSWFLPARHYVWIPAGCPHFLEQRNSASTVRNIYFPVAAETPDHFINTPGIYPASDLILEMLLYTDHWKSHIRKGEKGYSLLTALYEILPDVSKHPLPIALPTTDNEKLQPVLRYLHENLSRNLSMTTVAEQFGFSERNLFRLFRSELDISFLQYLKMLRVIKGMEMLLKGDLTISEIAWETGYESISAFSNTFYQVLGVRPSAIKV